MSEQTQAGIGPDKDRSKHGGAAEATAKEAPGTGQITANPPAEEGVNQAVRFSSRLQEIEPPNTLETVDTLTPDKPFVEPISAQEQEEIRKISKSLQTEGQLQKRRMSNFVFEPVSLPVSRMPSNEGPSSRNGSISSRHNPSIGSVHTPPLTPAGSTPREQPKSPDQSVPSEITPQTSGPHDLSATSSSTRPSSSGQSTTRPTTISSGSTAAESKQRPSSVFVTGASDSASASRDTSPSRVPGATSGTSTPPTTFSRPFTPAGERDDPYARSKRPPQPRNLDSIDARFVFGGRDSRRSSAILSPTQASSGPRSSASEAQGQTGPSSVIQQQQQSHHHQKRGSGPEEGHKHVGSMADLKRFFHIGHSRKHTGGAASAKSAANSKGGTRTPEHQAQSAAVPFADDHGLQSKYGKFGKVLGSGAGGSVRLMKRPSDGVTFAVKQFRDKHSYESEREYAKKVTAEFCIGSTLHHGNIIETMDIIQERGHWYEVMEYAPYDLFAIVMTGKMSREEIVCSFLQIVAAVTYLHSMGLAHRDLKLDNVVVNEHGIMKIIDFGSATVFKYPFETDVVLATGIVGSDPYLAPEVYDNNRYDPQPTDIWSLAIIFACMSLRRFPWRAPRLTDNSYKLFVAPPTPGTPMADSVTRRRSQAAGDAACSDDKSTHSSHHHHHHNNNETSSTAPPAVSTESATSVSKSETIRGPWRLLRLLPRESRNIISLMLEVDPKHRATLDDMMEDPWITNTPVCRQIDHGQIIKATGHTHTLEPGQASETPAQTKK